MQYSGETMRPETKWDLRPWRFMIVFPYAETDMPLTVEDI